MRSPDDLVQTARELFKHVSERVTGRVTRRVTGRVTRRVVPSLHGGGHQTLAHGLDHLHRHERARMFGLPQQGRAEGRVAVLRAEAHVAAPLHQLLHVATPHALTHRRTRYLRLVTFTIILEASTSFTVAALVMPPYDVRPADFCFPDFRPKRIRIPL